jgi:hypothetical protein
MNTSLPDDKTIGIAPTLKIVTVNNMILVLLCLLLVFLYACSPSSTPSAGEVSVEAAETIPAESASTPEPTATAEPTPTPANPIDIEQIEFTDDEQAAYDYMMVRVDQARFPDEDEILYYVSNDGAIVTGIVPHDAEEQRNVQEAISIILPDTVGGYPITGLEVSQVGIGQQYYIDLYVLPDTVKTITQDRLTSTTRTDFILVGENNPNFTSVLGAVYNKELTQLVWASLNDRFTFRVLDGVSSIADYGLNNNYVQSYASYKAIKEDPALDAAVNQSGYTKAYPRLCKPRLSDKITTMEVFPIWQRKKRASCGN